MKEITRINLAGLPFNIEIKAHHDLEKYLQAVKKALAVDDDSMKEIEARVVELLAERSISGERVIDASAVAAIKSQLGYPNELAGESVASEPINELPVHRLMRDTDHAQVAGICAGLAAFFGIDVVWVRLATVVLTFLTAGTMIPLYLVAWMVIPPARTAADRLIMVGKPVTLDAIKKQSETMLTNFREPIIVTILRWIVGVGFALAGIGVLIATVVSLFGWNASGPFVADNGFVVALLIIVLLGLILLVALLELIAYMLLTKKFTKNLATVAAIIILAGLTMFASSIVVGFSLNRHMEQTNEKSMTSYNIDTSAVTDATKLILGNDQSVKVTYVATTDKPHATVRYSKMFFSKDPAVRLVRDGDAVKVESSSKHNSAACFNASYCDLVDITIYGPALNVIETTGQPINYTTTSQPTLAVKADKATVNIISRQTIGTLSAAMTNDAHLDATQAGIGAVALEGDTTLGGEFATINQLAVTIPTVCASNAAASISYSGTPKVTLNGGSVSGLGDHDCISFTRN